METTENNQLERAVMRRVTMKLIPFLIVCYFFALLDRVNVGFAGLQITHDLGLTATTFGLGGTMFFIGYFFLEVPSNLALQKYGARLWICRIMVTWGLISACMSLIAGPYSFYILRFLLGAAEAGFFPGVILYMTYWFPRAYRARIVAIFMVAIPVASFLGSPLSAALLAMDGVGGLRGWQWLFLLEGLPPVALGLACLRLLPNRPADAPWLTGEEKSWLGKRIDEERAQATTVDEVSFWRLIRNPRFVALALIYSGPSAVGTTLSVWQPQLLKSFNLTTMQVGWVNAIPYGVASVVMLFWGRNSDRLNERKYHTAIPLLLIACAVGALFVAQTLVTTVAMLVAIMVGAYSFKGPFWAFSSSQLSPKTLAAGLAAINAIANLVGGNMITVVGFIKERTGSLSTAMYPLVFITVAGAIAVFVLTRSGNARGRDDLQAVKP